MLAVYECQNRNEKSESTSISNNLLTKSEDCAGKYQTEILLNACMYAPHASNACKSPYIFEPNSFFEK